MPRRPRAHELESESRAALRGAIPGRWVFRDMPEDYGIDGEVEVFDSEGVSTGALVKVQLKSTDESDLSRALGVVMEVDRLTFGLSLDLPVLLVLFHAPTGSLFVQWFHAFDAFPQEGQGTITLRLVEEDRWTAESAEKLETDVANFRSARGSSLALPVPVTVLANGGQALGFPIARIRLALRNLIDDQPGIVRITAAPERGLIEVRLGDDEWLVRVAGERKLILQELRSYTDVTAMCNDVLLAIGMALARHGHRDAAAPILVSMLPKSAHLNDWELVHEVGVILSTARRGDDVVAIARAVADLGGEDADAAIDHLSTWVLMAPRLGDLARTQWGEICDSRVELAAAANDQLRLGRAHYNRANLRRGEGRYAEAIEDYDAALQGDPGYANRDYWHSERAGCLFEERRYEESGEGYRRALELGANEDRIRPLFADALAYCGRYADALQQFLVYQEATGDPDPAWTVKIAALAWLCNERGIAAQERDEDEAHELVHAHAADAGEDEIIAAAEEAIQRDALLTCAWWNWSTAHLKKGEDIEGHIGPLLIAAAFNGGDPVKWAEATVATFHVRELLPIVPAIVAVAHFKCGEDYVQVLDDRMAEFGEEFPRNELMGVVERTTQFFRRPRPVYLRVLGPDEGYEVLEIGLDP